MNMQIITELGRVAELEISPELQKVLLKTLIKDFPSIDAAVAFWTDYGCFLAHLESRSETVDFDGVSQDCIEHIVKYPEYVTLIGSDEVYMLAMSVLDDAGAGGYLLMPLHQKGTYQHTLMKHVKLNNQPKE